LRSGFSYRDISTQFGSSDPNLIAYEPFNYDAGIGLVGAGGVNAFWDGAWENNFDAFEQNQTLILDGSLEQSGVESQANRVEVSFLDASQVMRPTRPIAEKFAMSEGNEYWVSFFMNTTQADAFSNVNNLVLTTEMPGFPPGGQAIAFGRGFDAASGPLGIILPGAGGISGRTSGLFDDGFHWIVARLVSRPDEETDLVAMWIDPSATSTPDTATAQVLWEGARIRDVEFSGVMIKTEAAGPGAPLVSEYDELRIARTFTAATGGTVNTVDPLDADPLEVSAYPNPLGNLLNVEWVSETSGRATGRLLDIQGREVARLFEDIRGEGKQKIASPVPSGLPNGFYYLQVVHGDRSSTRKMILYR